jgi:putative transposase
MEFENGQIYHVFNRGNNSQTVFFSNENYQNFIDKMEEYIKPFARILAWCLMPNHFHILLKVENAELDWGPDSLARNKWPGTAISTKALRSLNKSIAIMLRLYTRHVNSEDEKQGPLFHQRTKALCLSKPEFAPAYFQNHFGLIGKMPPKEKDYPSICFNYIHFNPVTGKQVERPEDWEFSSYRDYFSGREGRLVDKELAKELKLFSPNSHTSTMSSNHFSPVSW